MIGILIEAVVLVVLIQAIAGIEVEIFSAVGISVLTSLIAYAAAVALIPTLGLLGLLLASAIAAAVLAVVVSAFYGAEIKRAALVGAAFMGVHLALSFGLRLLFA
ncbi:MAG TPA: hypothetical protein VGE52_14350 [Pirellulales bacterium]